MPPAVHNAYIQAFSAALHPVFIVAAAISAVAFGLTWMLREIPLRKTTAGQVAAAEAGVIVEPMSPETSPAG